MNILKRLAGLVLLLLMTPWIALWAFLMLPFLVIGGQDGAEFAMWMVARPLVRFVEPLLTT